MARPNQHVSPQNRQRTLFTRIVGIGMVLASTVVWYQNSPLRKDPVNERVIRVEKHEGMLSAGTMVLQKSEAQKNISMVGRSLLNLKRIKHPTKSQQQQISSLENQQKLVSKLADYELRVSLHEADSSAEFVELRSKISQLRAEVSTNQMD